MDYGVSNNGNLMAQTISDGASWSASQSYAYDKLDRLLSAEETGTANTWKETFEYDRWGNRWVDPATAKTYGISLDGNTPQTSNWFTTKNRLNLPAGSFDMAGNQTRQNPYTMTYDAESRLTNVTSPGSGPASYNYDGEGHRIKKVTGGLTTYYVYDAKGQVAAEYEQGTPSVTPPAPYCSTCYLFADHLGSTRAVWDSTGVRARFDYLPFGEPIQADRNGRTSAACVPGVANCYVSSGNVTEKFTGKERDAETGLDFFGGKLTDPNGDTQGQMPSQENSGSSNLPPGLRFGDFISRYYSSAQERFTSPDFPLLDQSVESPQSWNLFSYVMNNPLTFFDPNGGKCKKTKDGFEGDCVSPGDEKVTEGDKAQVANVNGQQGSLFRLFMASGVPRYVPNDKPLPENARKVITVAYLRTQHDLGCVGLGGAITGGSVAASSPIIPKPFSAGGVSSTSPASKVLGGINIGKSIPTPVGMPGTSSFAWRASANLGRIAGRYLPYVGTVVGAAATYACLSN